ncbi:MAG: hypothetical protein QNK82_00140 [Akkermansiaceae bacterium]|jgi:hypothetical protein
MTAKTLLNKTSVKLGFVPAHIQLAGSHIPDESGRLGRNEKGKLKILAGIAEICELSPVKLDAVQIMTFSGIVSEDSDELINGIYELDLEPQLVLMVGGVDPVNPADEDACVEVLKAGVDIAKRHKITHIGSTSAEAWMASPAPADEAEYKARVTQCIRLHSRIFKEADLSNSCIESWNLEFLRPGEMNTFTSIRTLQPVVEGINSEIGCSFFKVLVDAAHCGDGDFSITENAALMKQLAEAGEFDVYHASAHTTRGCLSTDDGWVGALLTAAAETGHLKYVFSEIFHHEDPALQALRDFDPRHGVDTTDGRSYSQTVAENLGNLAHRLNNLKNRGLLA